MKNRLESESIFHLPMLTFYVNSQPVKCRISIADAAK